MNYGWYLCDVHFIAKGNKVIYSKQTIHRSDKAAKSIGLDIAISDFARFADALSFISGRKYIKHGNINYNNVAINVYISWLKDFSMMDNQSFIERCRKYGVEDIHDTFDSKYSAKELIAIRNDLTGIKMDKYKYDGYLHYDRTIRFNAFTDLDNMNGLVDTRSVGEFKCGDKVEILSWPYEGVIVDAPSKIYSNPMWTDQYMINTLDGEQIPFKFDYEDLKLK